ncbi:hypothetical protein LTR22_027204, partial [Elasticomyces elasticus]
VRLCHLSVVHVLINMDSELIDTVPVLEAFLDGLVPSQEQPLLLYVDLEGNDLSRHGTLSLVTILIESRRNVFLIDVTTLGGAAFTATGLDHRSLLDVLQSPKIVKVFFVIRNDSDTLCGVYGVRVGGVEDLQLMELASRSFNRKHVNGLAKCIERDAPISSDEKIRWWQV